MAGRVTGVAHLLVTDRQILDLRNGTGLPVDPAQGPRLRGLRLPRGSAEVLVRGIVGRPDPDRAIPMPDFGETAFAAPGFALIASLGCASGSF